MSQNPVNYTPNVTDDGVGHSAVYGLTQIGNTIYAGGKFARVTDSTRTTSYGRTSVMSFSASTGAMTPFAPSIDGDVWALEPNGSSLYIGGAFTAVNGVARRGIVKVDATTGAVDPTFKSPLRYGRVTQIRLAGGRLYVSGSFPQRLLALDPTTGANTGYVNIPITGTLGPKAGPVDVYRFAIDPSATRLVAIGNFSTVAGQPQSRAFMLTLGKSVASLSPWFYQPLQNKCRAFSNYLRDVDFSPDGSFFAIDGTGGVPERGGVGRDICDAAARFETNIDAPTRPTWINYTGGDTLHSIAVTNTAVYVNGHNRWLDNPNGRDFAGPGAVNRPGVGAIDPTTGKALPWNPTKTRGVGGKDLLVTAAGLWVGSDGPRFHHELHDNIAFCPLP